VPAAAAAAAAVAGCQRRGLLKGSCFPAPLRQE
jgi:hypothetical protein